MKIMELQQGTNEWLEWRKSHRTASDAAAMLDISGAYRNRQSLLKEKLTGKSESVSDYQQVIFDAGHAAEDSAREIIEEQIGEPLLPVIGVLEGTNISASFDGMTFAGDVIWEHKHMTGSGAAKRRYELAKKGELDDKDMAQVQQQLLVSGAKKCLFTVSDGTSNYMATVEVRPDETWFDRIKDGWAKFDEDLESMAVVETDNADWVAAAKDLQAIRDRLKEIQQEEKEIVSRIKEMAESMEATTVIGGGITCQRVERKGSVDYSAIPQLMGVDLNEYRKPGSNYWKVL